jgi:5-methylcytosine-specific restriction endonuclease McrA
MSSSDDSSATGELAGFAERMLAVIDEGRRTATYKLALLLALMDCCAEGVSSRGEAPRQLHTRVIARRVAELYWPQLRPFPLPVGAVELRQITMKSSTVVTAVRRALQELPGVGTWRQAEEHLAPDRVAEVLDVVELAFARDPLVRLQTVDGVSDPFIYDIDWDARVTLRRLQGGEGGLVVMRPGAGDQLIRLAPLLRPLVELHWVRMVANINQLDLREEDLRRHLFGAQRVAFAPDLRHGLAELQEGRCFYCPDPLAARTAVDHFVPWSRWPNDAIENLVIAHPACNSHKSDRIPGPVPLRRWARRIEDSAGQLSELAVLSDSRSDRARTTSLARSVYAHLPHGAPVWDAPRRVSRADNAELLGILDRL